MKRENKIKPIIRLENLKVEYRVGGGFFRPATPLCAVDDISLSIPAGSFFSIVGESGSGKTSLARAILKAAPITGGSIHYNDGSASIKLEDINAKEEKSYRKRVQMVLQDPYSSLSPRMTIRDILAEPLELMGLGSSKAAINERIKEVCAACRINLEYLPRYPHAFSGGQRQRIAIARALVTKPRVIVADESVAALDVSLQADILNLLVSIQREQGVTVVLISHDLSVVARVSDFVAVMYLGQVVEMAPASELFSAPLHPYTAALISAIPSLDPDEVKTPLSLNGEIPSPLNPPTGCRFHTRCIHAADVCIRSNPEMRWDSGNRAAACHFSDQLARES